MGTLAVPVVGVAASWLQLGERPTAVEAAGMTLIITALAVLAAYGVRAGRSGGQAGDAASIPPVSD
jgi:drug/metabolite transporter (DMT)-like permease